MSVSSVEIILERIKSATEDSQIAVFKLPKKRENCLDAMFSSTLETKIRIEKNDPLFVGNFHQNMDRKEVYKALRMAAA